MLYVYVETIQTHYSVWIAAWTKCYFCVHMCAFPCLLFICIYFRPFFAFPSAKLYHRQHLVRTDSPAYQINFLDFDVFGQNQHRYSSVTTAVMHHQCMKSTIRGRHLFLFSQSTMEMHMEFNTNCFFPQLLPLLQEAIILLSKCSPEESNSWHHHHLGWPLKKSLEREGTFFTLLFSMSTNDPLDCL